MKERDRTTPPLTYKDVGVDVEKGEQFVERIKKMTQNSPWGKKMSGNIVSGVGGFCSLYDQGDGRLLAAGTDGVGTKLLLAQEMNCHHTVGIDLVAMCANDILCSGARPLFFLDYIGTGRLDLAVGEALIQGIVEGCERAQMPLMGGETAEMPGLYGEGEYDLAGFAVGEVQREHLIDGRSVRPGDVILGLPSSGFHSNGFGLLRKLLAENDNQREFKEFCLRPTRIYVQEILSLLKKYPGVIKGLAHITGGGMRNIPRINDHWGYELSTLPQGQQLPLPMLLLCKQSGLDPLELYSTFNMGVGMVMIADPSGALELLRDFQSGEEKIYTLGKVTEHKGQLSLKLGDKWYHYPP